MTQPHGLRAAITVGTALLLAMGAAQARQSTDSTVPPAVVQKQAAELARGDPARWYREDRTSAERLRTLRKEIGAALQEAQRACRAGPASERRACLDDARTTYQQDMAQAPALAAQAAAD